MDQYGSILHNQAQPLRSLAFTDEGRNVSLTFWSVRGIHEMLLIWSRWCSRWQAACRRPNESNDPWWYFLALTVNMQQGSTRLDSPTTIEHYASASFCLVWLSNCSQLVLASHPKTTCTFVVPFEQPYQTIFLIVIVGFAQCICSTLGHLLASNLVWRQMYTTARNTRKAIQAPDSFTSGLDVRWFQMWDDV